MGGAAQNLDLQMQAAVMGVGHAVGKSCANRQIGLRDALFEQP
jgi:hypothetical protein